MKQILFLLAAVLLLGGCAEEKKTDVRWATFNIRYDNPQFEQLAISDRPCVPVY